MEQCIADIQSMKLGVKRTYEDRRWTMKGHERQLLTSRYLRDIETAVQELNDMHQFLSQQYNTCKAFPRNAVPSDYDLGHLSLLSQLSPFDFNKLHKNAYSTFITEHGNNVWVIERDDKIVASGTLFIEPKLIHVMGKVGHIEDVVVDVDYRNTGLGMLLIDTLVEEAKRQNCYKIVLDCNDDNVSFYERCGFTRKGNMMAIYM